MKIKTLKLNCFRSYRKETVFHFDGGVNAIMGVNGSGKSNIILAMELILNRDRATLSSKERLGLISTSEKVLCCEAKIELTLSAASDEPHTEDVVISRVFTASRDSFLIDNKPVNRNSIDAFLSSLCSSPEYSYNIVTQGKVSALASCDGKTLLEHLFKIVGYNSFLQAHRLTREVLLKTRSTLQQCDAVLFDVEKRLEELKIESEEAKAHDKLERRRMTCERILVQRRLNTVDAELKTLQRTWDSICEKSAEWTRRFNAIEASTKENNAQLSALKANIWRLTETRDSYLALSDDLVAQVSCLEFECTELLSQKRSLGDENSLKQEQKNFQERAETLTQRMEALETEIEHATNECFEFQQRRQEALCEREWLFMLADERRQFRSVSQRNTVLATKIAQLDEDIANKQDVLEEVTQELENQRSQLQPYLNDNEQYGAFLEEWRKEEQELREKIEAAKMEELHLIHERQNIRGEEAELSGEHNAINIQIEKAENRLCKAVGWNRMKSIRSMMQMFDELESGSVNRLQPDEFLRLRGSYMGVLVSQLEFDPALEIVVNVVGNKFNFYHVVGDIKCAMKLIEYANTLTDDKGVKAWSAEHNFAAINRLFTNKQTPQLRPGENRCVVLTDLIVATDSALTPLVHQVFGATLLVKREHDLEAVFADYKVNCVTLSGDFLRKSGSLSGGYYSLEENSVRAYRSYQSVIQKALVIEQRLETIRSNLAETEACIQQLVPRRQKAELKHEKIRTIIVNAEENQPSISETIERKKKLIREFEIKRREIAFEVGQLRTVRNRYEGRRLTTTLHPDQLNSSERKHLIQLSDVIEENGKRERDLSHRINELQNERNAIAEEIRFKIRPRLTEIEMLLRSPKDIAMQLTAKEELLEIQRKELSRITNRLKEVEDVIARTENELNAAKKRSNDLLEKRSALNDERVAHEQSREAHLTKLETLNARRHELSSIAKGLGAVTRDYDKFSKNTNEWLEQEIETCRRECEMMGSVNLKACALFSDGQSAVVKAKNESALLKDSFSRFKNCRNQQRAVCADQIQHNFRLMASVFPRIFKRLVPHGVGKMTFVKSSRPISGASQTPHEGSSPSQSSTQTTSSSSDDSFVQDVLRLESCQVEVTFEGYNAVPLQNLSGGQRTITALAIILTIQELDPARFYIFDEIDADLDASRREALAQVIATKAREGTQFICASFHRNIPAVAGTIYRVKHQNNCSMVQKLTTAEKDSHNED